MNTNNLDEKLILEKCEAFHICMDVSQDLM